MYFLNVLSVVFRRESFELTDLWWDEADNSKMIGCKRTLNNEDYWGIVKVTLVWEAYRVLSGVKRREFGV